MDIRLRQIVAENNFKAMVFGLIEYCQVTGKVEDLLIAAYRVNPGNYKLRSFYQNILATQEEIEMINKLTGEEYEQFHGALLSAYNENELNIMLRFELDKQLNVIATGASFSEIIFRLIQWAEREGELQNLLIGAYKRKPENPKLRSFYQQMVETKIPRELVMNLSPKQLQEFQKALMSAFNRRTLKQMLFFELGQNLGEIVGTGNLSDIVFDLIEWAKANGELEALLKGARNQNKGNPDLLKFEQQILGNLSTNTSVSTQNNINISPLEDV